MVKIMRIYLGSDHAGWGLKNYLVTWLADQGHVPFDCGPHEYDAQDDYPPYVLLAAAKVAEDKGSLGIVIGGSGNGEAMAANKVNGVRAALAWSEETARLAREHNNANVVSTARGCIARKRRLGSSRPSSRRRPRMRSGTTGVSRCSLGMRS